MICKKCGEKLIQNDKYCKKCQTSCLSQIKLNNYSMDKDFVSFMNSIGIKYDKSNVENSTITVPNDSKVSADNINISCEIPLVNEYDTNKKIYKKEEFQNLNKFKHLVFPYESDSNTSICDNMIIDNENLQKSVPQSDNTKTFEEDTYQYDKTTIYLIFILIIVIIISVASMIIMYSKDKKEKEPVNNIVTNITTNLTENNIDEIIIDENNTDTTDITNFNITTSTIITSTLPDYLNSDVITNTEQYTESEIFCEDNEEQDYDLYGDENNKYDKLESEDENYLKSFALDIDKLVNNYE